jgi:hypothetical protein
LVLSTVRPKVRQMGKASKASKRERLRVKRWGLRMGRLMV